jgi:hypothetical protein
MVSLGMANTKMLSIDGARNQSLNLIKILDFYIAGIRSRVYY